MLDYQRQVWSQPAVEGYDEVMDMSAVEAIADPQTDRVRQFADLAAGMDADSTESRFAIVAPGDLAFGLGRMFQAYRSLNSWSTKTVAVFRSLEDALRWLGLDRAWPEAVPAPPTGPETAKADQGAAGPVPEPSV
jgi:hypothetical protein